MVPGAGAKPCWGSSAFRRASMAWPNDGGGSPSSSSPAAMRSCSLTRSTPVVISVTGCSTWSRVFTSRNATAPSSGRYRNSTVPTLRYPAAATSPVAASAISALLSGVSTGEADSSMTFWLRRWMLQSRTPSAHTLPATSAATWTSMWRAPVNRRSMNTVGSPNDRAASALARSKDSARPSIPSTNRIPRPPPPAAALTRSGNPMRSAWWRAASRSSTGPPLHAATGAPTCSASRFAPILSPRRRMTSPGGPMNVTPIRSHRSANSGCSATNPHPTHAASAPVSSIARSSAEWSR